MDMNNTTPMMQTFNQIKTEGGTRSQRIGKILKDAFNQTSAELKEGYTIVRPLAAEMSATAAADLKEKRHQASSNFKEAWGNETDSSSTWERLQRVFQMMATALKKTLTPPLRKQATRVDTKFTDQYGDSYTSMKRGLQSLKNWYVKATDAADPADSSTQPQAVPHGSVTVDVVASTVESPVQ
ncbi:hypothetical protein [Acaryochloris sp. IP29b_bin.137]|uniref:hypothetical protein n=1 Tax=Acaryochloris sp. IP29b_bin.137 TaxID=2969217 RepID=UPI00260D3DEE|nr:hypothetical protein [Acaryochloris sp. IP29b_bin.137]